MWRRALRMASMSLPVLVLGIAGYIVLLRFTLAELPTWPVLFAFVPWLLFVGLWARAQRVSTAEAARYLDQTLELDERVSTSVELLNAAKLIRSQAPRSGVHYALLVDAAEALDNRLIYLPGLFRFRWTRTNSVSIFIAVLALVAAVAFPTYVELAKVERSAVAKAVQEQLAQVQVLRNEVQANEHLSSNLKSSILQELANLEQTLQNSKLDQASGIATLADAEQRLSALLKTPSADFDGLVAAAQLVWNVAAQNFEWDPEQAKSPTDLGRAADASLFLSSNVGGMDTNQERRVSFNLDRASTQASGRDPELARLLAGASTGVRTRDQAPAQKALAEASRKFAEADNQREDALALENVLSQLNNGREEIAQAGRTQSKKAQVGFRRRGTTASASPTPDLENFDPNAPAAQTGNSGTQGTSNVSGMGPVIGQSNVASYGGSPSSAGGGGQPAQTDGQGDTSPQSGGAGGGANGQNGGQSGGIQQSAGGGSAGGASSDSGQQGTLGGSINGPVGGAGGAISQVPNPTGRGNATSTDSTNSLNSGGNSQGDDQVYVPENASGETAGGSVEPNTPTGAGDNTNNNGVGGRVGEGDSNGAQISSSTGPGGAVRVQTPYREVLTEYSRQATEAIERAYVPPDAKQYVKDYFSELGK
jgi:hypothetical protein